MDSGHWDVSAVGEFAPADWFGFLYLIENRATGQGYLGKKVFQFKRQKTQANKSRTKESDWKDYRSSCLPLLDDIDALGEAAFFFRIVQLCSGKCELSYTEQALQFGADVLRARLPNGKPKFYNRTIAHFNYAGLEKQTAASRRKQGGVNGHEALQQARTDVAPPVERTVA